MALVGQECSFDAGRQQLEMLAGLEVTTKAIERIAESIGSDVEVRERETHQQAMVQQNRLDHGHVAKIVATLHLLVADFSKLCQQLQTEADYFERNAERMRYPEFRRQGLFVGSRAIEAGCKTIGARLKRSGMFWTVRGAKATSLCVARCSVVNLTTTGRPAAPDFHNHVAHPA